VPRGGAETTGAEAMRPRRLGPQRRRYAISCQPFGRKHLLIYRLGRSIVHNDADRVDCRAPAKEPSGYSVRVTM
jgi:hypothetical protein